MSADWLFDGTGAPDEEQARIESLLSRHGLKAAGRSGRSRRRRYVLVALAAGLLMVLALGAFAWTFLQPGSWSAEAITGSPTLDGARLRGSVDVPPGAWLEVGEGERARLQVGLLGTVELDPGTRVQVLASRDRFHRLHLAEGRLIATTLMPPRWFSVETPAGRAIDMGCAFTLENDVRGLGLLVVTEGQVAFEGAGREAWVPAGGRCTVDPESGPGTPVRHGASQAFRFALARLDADADGSGAEELEAVLREAEPADGLSLLHVLRRLDEPHRRRVLERLEELCPLPSRVAREDVLRLDHGALSRWQWVLQRSWR